MAKSPGALCRLRSRCQMAHTRHRFKSWLAARKPDAISDPIADNILSLAPESSPTVKTLAAGTVPSGGFHRFP